MMDTVTNEDQYHDCVMAVVTKINDMLHDSEVEFDVMVNALITMLAMAGKNSTLTQKEYCLHVVVQLNHIMASMSVQTHPVQTHPVQ
jgi:hypothetical protein